MYLNKFKFIFKAYPLNLLGIINPTFSGIKHSYGIGKVSLEWGFEVLYEDKDGVI